MEIKALEDMSSRGREEPLEPRHESVQDEGIMP